MLVPLFARFLSASSACCLLSRRLTLPYDNIRIMSLHPRWKPFTFYCVASLLMAFLFKRRRASEKQFQKANCGAMCLLTSFSRPLGFRICCHLFTASSSRIQIIESSWEFLSIVINSGILHYVSLGSKGRMTWPRVLPCLGIQLKGKEKCVMVRKQLKQFKMPHVYLVF